MPGPTSAGSAGWCRSAGDRLRDRGRLGDVAAAVRRRGAAALRGRAAARARARRARDHPDRAADHAVLPARRLLLHRRGARPRAALVHLDARRRPLRRARGPVLMAATLLDVVAAVLLGLGLVLA